MLDARSHRRGLRLPATLLLKAIVVTVLAAIKLQIGVNLRSVGRDLGRDAEMLSAAASLYEDWEPCQCFLSWKRRHSAYANNRGVLTCSSSVFHLTKVHLRLRGSPKPDGQPALRYSRLGAPSITGPTPAAARLKCFPFALCKLASVHVIINSCIQALASRPAKSTSGAANWRHRHGTVGARPLVLCTARAGPRREVLGKADPDLPQ